VEACVHCGDAAALAKRIPTFKEMAMAALDRFLAGDQPFLLQIEGACIDHAAHLNDIAALLGDQLAFDDTLGAVLDAIAGRDDIWVVVTSDHGNANPGLSGMGTAMAKARMRSRGSCGPRRPTKRCLPPITASAIRSAGGDGGERAGGDAAAG
jgi:alkaline phosphatase